MTPAFSARRRADEFDDLVTRQLVGTPLTEEDAARFAALLRIVTDLRSFPEVAPRPEFSAGLRERLMLEADTVLRPVDPATARLTLVTNAPVRTRRDRRLATVLGGAALIGATTSMAMAAQTALPGDSLYPVKRALENAETSIAGDDSDKGTALLAVASGRLHEVDELARRGTPEGIAAVPSTLETFSAQAAEASDLLLDSYAASGDEVAITELRDFASTSLATLLALEATLPDSARDELAAAAQQLAAIDDAARAACPSCPGLGISDIPAALLAAGGIAPAGVEPVSVPSARKPSRPARTRPGAKSTQPEVNVPEEPITIPDGTRTGAGTEDPAPDADSKSGTAGGGSQDPVKELTATLSGGGSVPTEEPLAPIVGGVLEGLGTVVDGTTGTLSR